MNDFRDKLIAVIATKAINGEQFGDLELPEPFGMIRWTGWKEVWNTIFTKHGQIVWFIPGTNVKGGQVFYVDLPSMNHGAVEMGGTFSIENGKYSISEYTTIEDVRRWFSEGLTLLIDDVLNECPWLLKGALPEKK